jgi:hypothetical protein
MSCGNPIALCFSQLSGADGLHAYVHLQHRSMGDGERQRKRQDYGA